jgi:hypothetical protein
MDWSDEHYVKLYTRDTLTWRCWGWEARTLFLNLLRKVNGSGFIETGTLSPVRALVVQLELPESVVDVGLAQLVASGTAELVDRAVLLPKYVEAQEARKSEAQKKRDYRDGVRRKRRESQLSETPSPPVHQVAPSGTALDPPSSALLSSAQKKTSAVDKPQRQPSTAESLFAWWQDRRGEAGLTTEAKPNIARLNSTLKPKLEHHGRPELELRYRAYLAEPKYKALEPPWPWQMFLAVIEQLKPKAASTAVRIVKAGDLYADP